MTDVYTAYIAAMLGEMAEVELMSDIADMMLDGTLCEGCGVHLEDSLGEFPQRCQTCQEQDRLDDITRGALELATSMKISCPTCRKRVKQAGLKDHMRDTHGVGKSGSEGK